MYTIAKGEFILPEDVEIGDGDREDNANDEEVLMVDRWDAQDICISADCFDMALCWADEAECLFAGVEMAVTKSTDSAIQRAWQLHFLLGHPSEPVMRRLLKTENFGKFNLNDGDVKRAGLETCKVCKEAKDGTIHHVRQQIRLADGLESFFTLTLPMCSL